VALKILVIDCDHGFMEPEHAAAKEAGVDLSFVPCSTADEVAAAAMGWDGLISQRFPLDRALIERLHSVRVIGRYGSGVDRLDVAAANALGKKVVYTPDFAYPDVADHAMGMILDMARQITRLNNAMKRDMATFGANYPARLNLLSNTERLSRRTLGIVGFGKIGRELARRAAGFGMNIVSHDPKVSPEAVRAAGARPASLEEVLRESDFVSLHTPLTAETAGMLGARELGWMKPTAFLINCGRAQVVDEGALVSALQHGRIAGAALDVTHAEPLPPDHPFLRMENVILTPHTAFYSLTSIQAVKRDIVRFTINAVRQSGPYVEFNARNQFAPIRSGGA
jgi:D-3-phosphoglycerate dehydrogenase